MAGTADRCPDLGGRTTLCGKQLRGYEKAAPKQLYRLFVATQGLIKVTHDELIVRFETRSHNPILCEAALDRERAAIPWLAGRRVRFAFA